MYVIEKCVYISQTYNNFSQSGVWVINFIVFIIIKINWWENIFLFIIYTIQFQHSFEHI